MTCRILSSQDNGHSHCNPKRKIRFGFIECFTATFLHTHSWLKWVDEDDDEDEVGHYWGCGLGKVQVRHAWRHLAGVSPTTGSFIMISPRPKEEVFKVFEHKRVDSLLLPWYDFLIMVPRARYGEPTVLCAPRTKIRWDFQLWHSNIVKGTNIHDILGFW